MTNSLGPRSRGLRKQSSSISTGPPDAALRTGPLPAPLLARPLGRCACCFAHPDGELLDGKGKIVDGLFSAGNDRASITSGSYLDPGTVLGPILTFAYLTGARLERAKPFFHRRWSDLRADKVWSQMESVGLLIRKMPKAYQSGGDAIDAGYDGLAVIVNSAHVGGSSRSPATNPAISFPKLRFSAILYGLMAAVSFDLGWR